MKKTPKNHSRNVVSPGDVRTGQTFLRKENDYNHENRRIAEAGAKP